MMILLSVVVAGSLASLPPQGGSGNQEQKAKPDCFKLIVNAPGPGVALLCEAEGAVRAAGAESDSPTDEQRQAWRSAASQFARAAGQLTDADLKIYALEEVVRLNDATHLDDPQQTELALRELVGLTPSDPAPIFRLAKFEEDQGRLDAAEATLLSARQQHPQNVDVFRELSDFYGRRASAHPGGVLESGAEPEPPARGQVTPDQDGYYRAGSQVPVPEKIGDVVPEYPAGAREAGAQGMVAVELKLDENGTVVDARVVRSVPLLDEAALNAARQWRFAPAMLGDRPVPAKLTVPVPFKRR